MSDEESGGGEDARSEAPATGPMWDPWGHIEKIRALLPKDGSVVPIDTLRQALGNRSIKGTVNPLANAMRDVVGLRFVRKSDTQGGIVGVKWAPRIGIDRAPVEVQRYHDAARTGATQRPPLLIDPEAAPCREE